MKLHFEAPLTFQERRVPKGIRLAGWAALAHGLGIQAPVRAPSGIAAGHIRDSRRREDSWCIFDKRYWPGSGITDHLTFALRHERLDLLVLKRFFDAIPAAVLAAFVREAPTGAVTRRAWFFYEALTGRKLELDDAPTVAAVDALDPKRYFTVTPILSRRHRVRDNLLGSRGWAFGILITLIAWYPVAQSGVELLNFQPGLLPLMFFSGVIVALMFVPYGLALEMLLGRFHRWRS